MNDFLKPQTRMILEHLRKKGSVTRVEAAALYKTGSLTKRISELRHHAGIRIRSEWRTDPVGDRYVRYFLEERAA